VLGVLVCWVCLGVGVFPIAKTGKV